MLKVAFVQVYTTKVGKGQTGTVDNSIPNLQHACIRAAAVHLQQTIYVLDGHVKPACCHVQMLFLIITT